MIDWHNEPADGRSGFWAFVDETLNLALERHEKEDPATRDDEVLKYVLLILHACPRKLNVILDGS